MKYYTYKNKTSLYITIIIFMQAVHELAEFLQETERSDKIRQELLRQTQVSYQSYT